MHPAILHIMGCILLLSSFITFVILLQKGRKHKIKSSFYVLSLSDVFSTILTAAILLLSHLDGGTKLNFMWLNNTNTNILNRTWTAINDKEIYQFLLSQICNCGIHKIHDLQVDFNATSIYTMQNIFTQYGILIAPLTNAFISLLTFFIQCNFNATCIKQIYTRIIDLSVTDINTDENTYAQVTYRKRKILKDNEDLAFQQEDDTIVDNTSNITHRIVKSTGLKKDDKKLTCLLVISHWFVPFLAIGILYFARHNDINIIGYIENTECIFKTNLPINNNYLFSNMTNNMKIVDLNTHISSLKDDDFINKELLNKSDSNNTEIDWIISKVQNIVQIALNYTSDSTENTEIISSRNSSESQNVRKYVEVSDRMSYFDNNINVNNTDNELTNQSMNIHNLSSNTYNNTSIYTNQNTKILLFYDLIKNRSEELDTTAFENLSGIKQLSSQSNNNSYQKKKGEKNVVYYEPVNVPIVRNSTSISNFSEIYPHIIQDIQATTVYGAAKSSYNRINTYYNKEQSNNYKIELPNLIKNNSYNTNVKSDNSSLNMINMCLISSKFLKWHLFILFFTTYLLPILYSYIVQVRGKYICKNMFAMLQGNIESISRICQNYMEIQNVDTLLEIVECIARIFKIINLTLILCIILWTPILLGTLLRTFMYVHAPQWFIDITFLSAISFNILRNILNLNIIKILEFYSNTNGKRNSIQPIK